MVSRRYAAIKGKKGRERGGVSCVHAPHDPTPKPPIGNRGTNRLRHPSPHLLPLPPLHHPHPDFKDRPLQHPPPITPSFPFAPPPSSSIRQKGPWSRTSRDLPPSPGSQPRPRILRDLSDLNDPSKSLHKAFPFSRSWLLTNSCLPGLRSTSALGVDWGRSGGIGEWERRKRVQERRIREVGEEEGGQDRGGGRTGWRRRRGREWGK